MKNDEMEKLLKAVANKRRLAIIRYLKKSRTATVVDIAEAIQLSFKATSKHLGILYAQNILDREHKNVYMYYSLADSQPKIIKQIIANL